MSPNVLSAEPETLNALSDRGFEAQERLFAHDAVSNLVYANRGRDDVGEALVRMRTSLTKSVAAELTRHGIAVEVDTMEGVARTGARIAVAQRALLHNGHAASEELRGPVLDIVTGMRQVVASLRDAAPPAERDLIEPNVELMNRGDEARRMLAALHLRSGFEAAKKPVTANGMPVPKGPHPSAVTPAGLRPPPPSNGEVVIDRTERPEGHIHGDLKSFLDSYDPPPGTAATVPSNEASAFPEWLTAMDAGPTNALLITLTHTPEKESESWLHRSQQLKDLARHIRILGIPNTTPQMLLANRTMLAATLRAWLYTLDRYKQPEVRHPRARVRFTLASVGTGLMDAERMIG